MKYSKIIMEHFDHPRYGGVLAGATATGRATNSVCMDVLQLNLRVEDGVVVAASFQAEGCVPVMAVGSWLSEHLRGLAVAEVRALDAAAIEQGVGGLPSSKKHAALIAVEALQNALKDVAA